MNYRIAMAGLFTALTLGIGGCATTNEPALKESIAKAQSTADEAKTMAAEAKDIAMRAEQKASTR